jgi:hypothetical protein
VVLENIAEALDLVFDRGIVAQAKQDHPGMGLPTSEDQLAEVSVIGEKDAAFSVSDR